MTADLLSVTVRALGFIALFQAAGGSFFLVLFGPRLTRAQLPVRRLGTMAATAGLLLLLLHLALEAPRMAGEIAGLWDAELQRLAWRSKSGVAQLLQAAGLLGVAVSLAGPARTGTRWAGFASLVAVGGFLLTGHTSAHPLRAALAPLLALHLLIAAFWSGSLAPLLLVMRLEARSDAAQILARFSVIAGWLVPLILLAGLAMAWILAGGLGVLRQPYGELLLAKLTGFVLLMLLATLNRWRLAPWFAAGGDGASLRRSIAAELALLQVILCLSAVLTSFYSPR